MERDKFCFFLTAPKLTIFRFLLTSDRLTDLVEHYLRYLGYIARIKGDG